MNDRKRKASEEQLVAEQEEAAAAEAAQIGGKAPRDSNDPTQQPLIEAGQGESEGAELTDKQLEESATHSD